MFCASCCLLSMSSVSCCLLSMSKGSFSPHKGYGELKLSYEDLCQDHVFSNSLGLFWACSPLFFLLIGYFLYLDFKCYPLSWFPSLLETPYPILPPPASVRVFLHPSTHSHLPALDSPTLGHLSGLCEAKDHSSN